MKKLLLLLILASCNVKPDFALERHFIHWKNNINSKDLEEFRQAKSCLTIKFEESIFLKSRKMHTCDSICQVGLIQYFEKHNNGSYSKTTTDIFLLQAFQKWLNEENIDYNEIMFDSKIIVIDHIAIDCK